MSLYAEASYFDGEPVQHCADRDESQRLTRKRELARQAIARPSPFDPAAYLGRMAPHHAMKAAQDARLIDAAMRAQRPQLKEIGE